MKTTMRDQKERDKADGAKSRSLRRVATETLPLSRRHSMESCKVEGRTKSASRLSSGVTQRGSLDVNKVEGRTKSTSRLGPRPSSRQNSMEGRHLERRGSASRVGTPIGPKRTLSRSLTSPVPPTTAPLTPIKSGRSTSVGSTYSTTSTYDSKMADGESNASDINELKKRLHDSSAETDGLRTEIHIKKEEVEKLRDKVMLLTRELSEVSTTKGALNEAFVSKMMDVLAMNAQISELEEIKARVLRQNQQLRHDAAENDAERRGLLDCLDEKALLLRDCENALEVERARKMEMEASYVSTIERLGMEVKIVRRELQEKTLRLKKLARSNTKLACKLLAVEADSAEVTDLAKVLASKNTQLEGDNQELVDFVVHLECQIDQMATERTMDPAVGDLNTQQLTRLEEERARMLNKILSLEKESEETKKELANGEDVEEQLDALRQEKTEMQNKVNNLTENIGRLKEQQTLKRKEQERMKEEYVINLEKELHAANARIDELSLTLKGARDAENETMSSHQKASEEISRLESDNAALLQKLAEMCSRVKATEDEMLNQAHELKQEKEREVQSLDAEVTDYKKKVIGLEKRMSEYQSLKQESDTTASKLQQDIDELEQQKEALAYQVNVLEWQLVALYSDKEDALRSLAHKDMEVSRLQQELEDKEDDLEQLRREVVAENEAQIEVCELHFAKDQMEVALTEASRRVKALEYELEQVKKGRLTPDDSSLDSKKRPWFGFRMRINF